MHCVISSRTFAQPNARVLHALCSFSIIGNKPPQLTLHCSIRICNQISLIRIANMRTPQSVAAC